MLKVRFDRDQRADWKIEYHRRRTTQQAAETELKVGRRVLNLEEPHTWIWKMIDEYRYLENQYMSSDPAAVGGPAGLQIFRGTGTGTYPRYCHTSERVGNLQEETSSYSQTAEDACSAAAGTLEAATAKLNQWKQAKEDERAAAAAAAAEEDEDGQTAAPVAAPPVAAGGEEEEEEVELSKEEEGFQAATARLQTCEAKVKATGEALAAATAAIEEPFVCYQAYWVEGMGGSVEAVEGVAGGGVAIRAAVWGRVPLPPPAAGDADAASPVVPPALYAGLKAASQAAGWDSKLCLLTTLEVELPPSPEGKKKTEKKWENAQLRRLNLVHFSESRPNFPI